MRAMVVERYGAPLQMADLPMPSPGPRQVLVRIIGCGVCRSDLKVVAGAMPFSPTLPLPHVPGHEISGEIVALGAGAVGGIGERVVVYHYWPCRACASCQAGEENLCTNLQGWVGFSSPGGFQEYLAVPDDCVLPLPANISPEHGGPLTCALGTAYHAVVGRGALRAGETAVVLGAGGVGLQVVQIARASGASIFAIDVQAHRLEAAREVGAQDAFPAGEAANEQVRAATGGRGADLVVDTVGQRGSLAASAALLRPGGRIVVARAVRGASVVTAGGRLLADLPVREGRSVALGALDASPAQVVDGGGLLAIPGVVDGHVHFVDPGDPERADFIIGGAAAAAG